MNRKVTIAVITTVSFVVLVSGFSLINKKEERISERKQTACTQEVKLCPDGSSVGRAGPNCDFEECLNGKESTKDNFSKMIEDFENWKTYTDKELGFEMKYPRNEWVEFDGGGHFVKGIFYKGIEKIDESTGEYYVNSKISIEVSFLDNPKNLSIQELKNSLREACVKGGGSEECFVYVDNQIYFKNTMIDGFPAFKSSFVVDTRPIPSYNVYIKVPEKYIILRGYGGEEMEGLFNKIISTIKFIK